LVESPAVIVFRRMQTPNHSHTFVLSKPAHRESG
jgi:hypothetical protein